MSRKELLALARSEGIRGRHRLTRADLVNALVEAYRRLTDIPDALRSRDRRDLIRLARAFAVERRSRLRKDDLVKTLEAKWATWRAAGGPQPPTASEPLEALPSGYGKTRLTLMAIDPYRIHAYWEIAPADLEAAHQSLGEDAKTARMVLRVYDVTGIKFDGTNAWHTFDMEVGAATNWYLTLRGAEKSHVADLGLRAPSGHFVPLGRSNVVQTPRAGPSDRWAERWVEVRWRARPILRTAREAVPDQQAQGYPVTGPPGPSPTDRGAASPEAMLGPPRVPAEARPPGPAGVRDAMGGETRVPPEREGLRAWPAERQPAPPPHAVPGAPDHPGGPGPLAAAGEEAAGPTVGGDRPEASDEPEEREGTPGLLGWRDLERTWTTSPKRCRASSGSR